VPWKDQARVKEKRTSVLPGGAPLMKGGGTGEPKSSKRPEGQLGGDELSHLDRDLGKDAP